jgi:hypothetical protein
MLPSTDINKFGEGLARTYKVMINYLNNLALPLPILEGEFAARCGSGVYLAKRGEAHIPAFVLRERVSALDVSTLTL